MSRWIICLALLAPLSCQKPTEGPPPEGVAAKTAAPSKVDGSKAKELVTAGAVLLDVRTQGEWDSGHIEGAKLLPVQELGSRMSEVGSKDQPVVVYCASGMRSARAATQLAAAGWTQVYDLGAMSNW